MNPIDRNIIIWQKANRTLLDSLMAERERLMATTPRGMGHQTETRNEEMSTYASQLVLLEGGCANMLTHMLYLQGKDPKDHHLALGRKATPPQQPPTAT
jgi:hypothetical protein